MFNLIKPLLYETRHRYRVKNSKSITCFNFHQVANKFDPRYHSEGTFTSFQKFIKIVNWIDKNYKIIDIQSALKMNKEKNIDGKYACITFDDGDKSIENVIPYLVEKNIYASFYINTAYLNHKEFEPFKVLNFIKHVHNKKISDEKINQLIFTLRKTLNRTDYDVAKKEVEKLHSFINEKDLFFHTSIEYIQSISSKYISFGLHGHTHDRFILLDENETIENLRNNIKILKNIPNYIPVFAIPFGRTEDWDYKTTRASHQLNLDILMANGGINIGNDIGFKRVPADNRNIIFEAKLGYFQ